MFAKLSVKIKHSTANMNILLLLGIVSLVGVPDPVLGLRMREAEGGQLRSNQPYAAISIVDTIKNFAAMFSRCDPIVASNVLLNCTITQKKVTTVLDCTKKLNLGTKVTMKCMPGFASKDKYKATTCSKGKKWNKPIMTCSTAVTTPTTTTEATTLESTTLESTTESTTDSTTEFSTDPVTDTTTIDSSLSTVGSNAATLPTTAASSPTLATTTTPITTSIPTTKTPATTITTAGVSILWTTQTTSTTPTTTKPPTTTTTTTTTTTPTPITTPQTTTTPTTPTTPTITTTVATTTTPTTTIAPTTTTTLSITTPTTTTPTTTIAPTTTTPTTTIAPTTTTTLTTTTPTTTTTLPPDYNDVTNVGVVRVYNDPGTWHYGRSRCKEYNATLLVINSMDRESYAVNNAFPNWNSYYYGEPNMWVGIQLINSVWQTSTSIPIITMPYIKWDVGYPKETGTCVLFNRNTKAIRNVGCDSFYYGYICTL